MAGKRSRRAQLKEFLTPEEFAVLSLGYSAARFMEEDQSAKEIRRRRNEMGQRLWYNHDPETDAVPCFEQTEKVIEDDGEVLEFRLPRDKWCEDCRNFNEAAEEAFMAYWHRKYARQGLTKAYRNLERVREEEAR
jgi:hypothetical protein